MKLNEAVVQRLKEILKTHNINQYQLSQKSGVPQSTLSTILAGAVKTIKLSTLYDICVGLNIEFKDFFDAENLMLKNIDD